MREFTEEYKHFINHIPNKEYKVDDIVIYNNIITSVVEVEENHIIIKTVTSEGEKNMIKYAYLPNEITVIPKKGPFIKYCLPKKCYEIKTINEVNIKDKLQNIIKALINYTLKYEDEFDINDKLITNLLYLFIDLKKKSNIINKITEKSKFNDYAKPLNCLFIDPFSFINVNFCCITFDLAVEIENNWHIKNIEIDVKIHALILCTIMNYVTLKGEYWILDDKFNKELRENLKKYKYKYKLESLQKRVQELVICKEFKYKNCLKKFYTLKKYENIEDNCSSGIKNRSIEGENGYDEEDIDDCIKEFEQLKNEQFKNSKKPYKPFKLDTDQINAIKHIFYSNTSILNGPPGAGKTEIIACVVYIYNQFHDNYISLQAPTGKAFNILKSNMNEKMFYGKLSGTIAKVNYQTFRTKKRIEDSNEAQFILPLKRKGFTSEQIIEKIRNNPEKYKNIYLPDKENKTKIGFKLGRFNAPITKYIDPDILYTDPSFIIIDEVSMVDFELFEAILEHVNSETKLLLCGDVNQLPSIGPGNILETLLKNEQNLKKNYKVCKLNKIYRLPANSALLNIIYKLRDETIIDSKDFYDETAIFLDFNKYFDIKSKNKEKEITKFIKNIKEKYKLDIKSKFLCYNTNKDFYFNVDIFNKCSQKIFNPDEKDNEKIYQKNFKNNDKAIRNKNDYSDKKMRANGEEATIVRINDSEQEVTFKYTNDNRDENEVMSKSTFYEEFDLNYACTFHKSQGDGWDDIIIFISPNTTFIKKNAIYTAMSRAKKRCIFISTTEDLKKCQCSAEPIISTFLKP